MISVRKPIHNCNYGALENCITDFNILIAYYLMVYLLHYGVTKGLGKFLELIFESYNSDMVWKGT